MNDEMSVADKAKLGLNLQRMLSGEPIQYIVGFQSFMDTDLQYLIDASFLDLKLKK